MRYDSTLTAFMLKKQPIGEADMLVTWYTQEEGKMRSSVAAARRTTSRLAYVLQPGSLAAIRLVGRGAPGGLLKLAGGIPIQSYITEFSEYQAVLHAWFMEVILRATPDAERNEELFALARDFFTGLALLGRAESIPFFTATVLIHLLSVLGIAVHEEESVPNFFSVSGGGFFNHAEHTDRIAISERFWSRYGALKNVGVSTVLISEQPDGSDVHILSILESFLEYHLERPIRSFPFLSGIIKVS